MIEIKQEKKWHQAIASKKNLNLKRNWFELNCKWDFLVKRAVFARALERAKPVWETKVVSGGHVD